MDSFRTSLLRYPSRDGTLASGHAPFGLLGALFVTVACSLSSACSSEGGNPGGDAGLGGGGSSSSGAAGLGEGGTTLPAGSGGQSSETGGTSGAGAAAGLSSAGTGGLGGTASGGTGNQAGSAGTGAGSGGSSGSAGSSVGGTSSGEGGAAGGAGVPAGSGGSGGSANEGGTGGGGVYDPCPTNGDPCKIVPLGDSITVGIGTGAKGGGYRVELFRKAQADGKRIVFDGVSSEAGPAPNPPFPSGFENRHSGRSGWTIEQIQGMAPSSLDLNPHIILLHAGTNDANGGASSTAPERLGRLLDQIFAADSRVLVVVAKLIPFPARRANVDAINAAIPNIVQQRAEAGKHVILVDMNTGYPAETLQDGIHPNQAGYAWMADVWYRAIGPLLD